MAIQRGKITAAAKRTTGSGSAVFVIHAHRLAGLARGRHFVPEAAAMLVLDNAPPNFDTLRA
jgi:hypothetical protein